MKYVLKDVLYVSLATLGVLLMAALAVALLVEALHLVWYQAQKKMG